MKRLFLMLIGALMGITDQADALAKEPSPPATDALVRGNNTFGLDLYTQLASNEGNCVFSPFAISTALAMTYAGAIGDTADEMAKTLHFNVPADQLHRAFHQLIVELKSRHGGRSDSTDIADLELFIANALWHQRGERILPDFEKRAEIQYRGKIVPVDFRDGKAEAVRAINEWVEGQTKSKIRELLKPNQIGPQTLLILTNALYFKGLWASPFLERRTAAGDFHVSGSETIRVPLMTHTDRFGYLDGKNFQALELAYKGRNLSFVILLPKAIDGLASLESTLNAEMLMSSLAQLSPHRVEVTLPRFKITSEFELRRALTSLGMIQAFDSRKADFSGMTGTREFALSAVVHKSFIDVQEAGTEAAAATAVVVMRSAAIVQTAPIIFRADHPFLFLIRDIRTGSILFFGRLHRPEA